jgi:feruloyl esterase
MRISSTFLRGSVCLGVLFAAALPGGASALDCEALGRADLSAVPEAPMQLTAARLVPAEGDTPAYCRVVGYASPNIGFEMRLPARDEDWNGKVLMLGCGGFCGAAFAPRCDPAVARGYACIVSDMGHRSTALDAKWAYNNRAAEIDFTVRATHVTAVAGKAISAAAFGRGHRYAYFSGCSTGGRQGMVEAQRFPNDFDGIIAGAPVISETGAGTQLMWSVLANLGEDGEPILKLDQLPMINQAAVAACDADDGLADGLIDDPRTCDFDPAELQCSGEPRADCLTTAQVEVVNKIYRGPVNSRGEALYTGGAMRGSELNWPAYVGTREQPALYYGFIGDLFRYLSFAEDPGPGWRPEDFDFDASPDRFGVMEQMFTGSNPDLRKFKQRGGKIISYHGWRDQSVVPLNTIDYYELATRTMGGLTATQDFFRLFMIPGMNHCTGGPGPDSVDYLGYLEAWVERGEAPEALIGAHLEDGVVQYRRPLYPYPDRARYRRGDRNDPESFRRVRGTLTEQ